MDRSYKFSIIQARPDKMRGERVNVGVVADGPSGLDIRLPEVRKLRHLTGHNWDDVATAFTEISSSERATDLSRWLSESDPNCLEGSEVFVLAKPGQLHAKSLDDYESAIRSILRMYVDRPKLSNKEKQNKINKEISSVLRTVGVLGRHGDTIDDGKVIQRFVISPEKEIVADFAYRPNGLKVVSTLDLRGLSNAAHSKACEKGATLYFAREEFGSEVKVIGVYAANRTEAESHRSEIEILRGFADGSAFNWMDPNERRAFQSALY